MPLAMHDKSATLLLIMMVNSCIITVFLCNTAQLPIFLWDTCAIHCRSIPPMLFLPLDFIVNLSLKKTVDELRMFTEDPDEWRIRKGLGCVSPNE